MSNRHRSPQSALWHDGRRLTRFSLAAHQYGLFFTGTAWQIYACGTYRRSMDEDGARATFNSYLDRLERALGSPVACVFVLERRRTSGQGMSPTPLHWHFAVAAPIQHLLTLVELVPALWIELFGDCKSDPYRAELPGMFYIAKTATHVNFDWDMRNLERMHFRQNRDLFAEQQTDSFVPDHVRCRVRADTLTMRSLDRPHPLAANHINCCRSSSAETARVKPRGGHHGRHW